MMNRMSRIFFNALALFLILCLAEAFAVAGPRIPASSGANATKDISQKRILYGRLEVPLRQTILVNGLSSQSGDTILSGSHLQTSFIAAIVEVSLIARIRVDVESDVVVTLDDKAIEVNVSRGSANLRTAPGVTGKVIMPDRQTCPSTPITVEEESNSASLAKEQFTSGSHLQKLGILLAGIGIGLGTGTAIARAINEGCHLTVIYKDCSASPTRPMRREEFVPPCPITYPPDVRVDHGTQIIERCL